jgi:hypothetical protein
MGCWSADSFGNDDALDWLAELESQRDLRGVEAALDAVLDMGDGYVEAPQASAALVAAEVVAAALGKPGTAAVANKSLTQWLETVKPVPTAEIAAKARAAVDRIRDDDSELHELWQDTDDYAAWLADVNDLAERLGA